MNAMCQAIIDKQIEAVMQQLERNNMTALYAPTAEDAKRQVQSLLQEGETVAVGGSVTLAECGITNLLRNGAYRFLDRDAAKTPEETRRIFLDSFDADTYLSSCNAVTLKGELVAVDGNGNRVAALCYGPRRVILVVGCNKIVNDIDAAITRIKSCAAPANATRLHCDTYCAKSGLCKGLNGGMTDGCESDARICCDYVVMAHQRVKSRVCVILVGEPVGF